MNANEPLAYRMSPKTLEDYVGQEEILGQDGSWKIFESSTGNLHDLWNPDVKRIRDW